MCRDRFGYILLGCLFPLLCHTEKWGENTLSIVRLLIRSICVDIAKSSLIPPFHWREVLLFWVKWGTIIILNKLIKNTGSEPFERDEREPVLKVGSIAFWCLIYEYHTSFWSLTILIYGTKLFDWRIPTALTQFDLLTDVTSNTLLNNGRLRETVEEGMLVNSLCK